MRVKLLKPGPQDVHFQNHAFDSSLGSPKRKAEFSKTIADFGLRQPEGFQIVEPIGGQKEMPDWVLRGEIKRVLLTAFPKLHTNPSQRRKAGRWAQVINMYYLQGMTAEQVAEELHETRIVIKRLIISISRVSKGLSATGCQRKK